METEKYRALLCVIQQGTLSGAAEQMGYTPSGISRMITALEEQSGLKLLIRTQSGVMPTAGCQELLPTIRDLVHTEEKYMQMAGDIQGLHRGNIVIGTSMDVFFPILSKLASEFTAEYPGISVELTDGISTKLLERMEQHQLDFAIMSKREGTVRWIPIMTDELVAMVNRDSKYATRKDFPVELFREETFIDIYHSDETDNSLMFQERGIVPKLHHSCANSYAAAAMIEAGLGITAENKIIAKRWEDRVKLLSLKPKHYVEIGIAVPESKAISPAAEKFLAFAEARILDSVRAE